MSSPRSSPTETSPPLPYPHRSPQGSFSNSTTSSASTSPTTSRKQPTTERKSPFAKLIKAKPSIQLSTETLTAYYSGNKPSHSKSVTELFEGLQLNDDDAQRVFQEEGVGVEGNALSLEEEDQNQTTNDLEVGQNDGSDLNLRESIAKLSDRVNESSDEIVLGLSDRRPSLPEQISVPSLFFGRQEFTVPSSPLTQPASPTSLQGRAQRRVSVAKQPLRNHASALSSSSEDSYDTDSGKEEGEPISDSDFPTEGASRRDGGASGEMIEDHNGEASSSSRLDEALGQRRKTPRGERRRSVVYNGKKRLHAGEGPSNPLWIKHKKHYFVLSNAGKPIYTRYGDESKITSLIGVIQAIVSFFVDDDDSIRCINAGEHKFVFLVRSPLYLVTVARTGESENQLRDQLIYLHSAIVSILTLVQLNRIFEQRENFDLRRLLGGTEVFIDNLCHSMDYDPCYLLGAIQCLRMKKQLRALIGANLLAARSKTQGLLYGILIARTMLINLLRPKKHSLHPSDLHLLFNMVAASSTFRSGSEHWTPICLPKFNSRGFLHVYVCYLMPDVCLLLISPDKDMFFKLSGVKDTLVEGLTSSGAMKGIEEALSKAEYTIAEIGTPGLRHFLYKSKSSIQYTCPAPLPIGQEAKEKKRLYRLYQYVHEKIHSRTMPRTIYYALTPTEAVLGLTTPDFELYAIFGPHMSKTSINAAAISLVRWIRKKEDSLFLSNSPVF